MRNERSDLGRCFLDFNLHTSHVDILWKCRYHSVGLGWGLRFCISDRLPGDAAMAGGEIYVECKVLGDIGEGEKQSELQFFCGTLKCCLKCYFKDEIWEKKKTPKHSRGFFFL